MAKKILFTTICVALFVLVFATVVFADSSNSTTKLGNEVTSSMNKTEKSMDDLGRSVEDEGKTIENKAVAGMTGNFNSGEVQETISEATGGLSQNAWIWIIMIVVALVIIAAVWYYATQQK